MKKVGKTLLSITLAIGLIFNVGSAFKISRDTKAEEVICAKGMDSGLHIRAKSGYMMDESGKTVMFSHNEMTRLPIASMCKIMTLLLSFEAIENGNLSMNEEICISERAASMGGSQVFLEANAKYSVKELIKSIVVCSANDSCVAMAERIAGNEDLFVDKMNEKAKEIGAENTLFANCTGLPKDPQYSCARDVAIMLKTLLSHKEYYEFGNVWMEKFTHPQGRLTEITNTNKLIRFYDGCDGGKTGYTSEAGFCLAATAKRNDMRIISVVIGEESSANRFEDMRTMFDFAFANYTASPIVEKGQPISTTCAVHGGKEKNVCAYPNRSVYSVLKRGEKKNITMESYYNSIKAPIEKDEQIGELVIYQDNVEIERVLLLACESVGKANFFDYMQDVAQNWHG